MDEDALGMFEKLLQLKSVEELDGIGVKNTVVVQSCQTVNFGSTVVGQDARISHYPVVWVKV